MSTMIPEAEAVEFVNELSQATGVLVSFGINAYYLNAEPNSAFVVFIDPSYLTRDAESKIEEYAKSKGLKIYEAYNDWGRFLKISKPKRVFASAFSP